MFRNQGTGQDGQPFDETFRVWITNAQMIDDVFQVQAGVNPNRFPTGALLTGPGKADHNLPWSWHLDPDDIAMAEIAMEVCDGRPSIVEQFLADYLKVGRFCPWGATLDSVEDYR
ncbi:MAG: BP74-related protein [Planctomycetota bacterium]